jgi:hypothetical protein
MESTNTQKKVMSFEEFVESEKNQAGQTEETPTETPEELPAPATEPETGETEPNLSVNMMDNSEPANETEPNVSIEQ